MKLTRGEFCQFTINARFQLLREFGKNIMEKQVRMKQISVYRIFDFYVEVYENLSSQQLERIEPVRNLRILQVYDNVKG